MFEIKEVLYTEKGYWAGTKYDVNYSSILSFLIKEAGKYCERYASDLFISWEGVVEALKKKDVNERFVFGIRDYGVDHEAFVTAYNDNPEVYGNRYIVIYVLTVQSDGDDVIMKLGTT